MKVVVLDTSALVRLYVPDGPIPPGTTEAIDAAWRGDGLLIAPELLVAELGAVLAKKERAGQLTRPEVDEVIAAALALPLRLIPHRGLLLPALRWARETGVSVYDALFLAATVAYGATLVTGDGELARAAAHIADGLAGAAPSP